MERWQKREAKVPTADTKVGEDRIAQTTRHCEKSARGVKAVKENEKTQAEKNAEEKDAKDALHSFFVMFDKVGSATIAPAGTRHEGSRVQKKREYRLKKDTDELEAVRVLFNDTVKKSKFQRNALKGKYHRKLLE